MIRVRKGSERGHSARGWLDSWHTFSFGDYFDPRHRGFRDLRVINEDRVQPGQGFATHPHRDMEIVTCVLEGALQHRDSLGNGSVIRPGEVQRMTAGTGINHSELNASTTEVVHLLQIWILPEREGLAPSYAQKQFAQSQRRGRLCLVASRAGRDGSVDLHQDVDLYSALLDREEAVAFELRPDRHAWIQVARGEIDVGDLPLSAGDGAAVSGERRLELVARAPSELLLFDLR
jgi:redox-sensitive bicupin YhaK (pirin superfamily)